MNALIIILSILWVLILILTIIGIYFKITGKDSEDFIKDGMKISKIYEIDDMYMFYGYRKGEKDGEGGYAILSSINKAGVSNIRNKLKSENSLLNRTIGTENTENDDFYDNACKDCYVIMLFLDSNKNNSIPIPLKYDSEGKIKGWVVYDQSLSEEERKKLEEEQKKNEEEDKKLWTDFESKYLSKIKAELSPD
jgi:hypothetical protein